jgi:archaellum biogenesis protein FlaJ (TadC family)
MTKMITSIIRFLNIILAALLAGVSFGIWIGFNPMNLSASGYLEQQQNMLLALRALMISLVISATIITIVSAILQKNNKSVFITLLIAALFFIACIIITRFGNKPIDDTIITWTKDSLPDNWTVLRNKWWSFHVMRSIAELIALFLVTLTSIKRD